MDYYVHKGGQQYGPYDEAAMQAMLAAGQVLPTDLCWNEQLPEWTAIGTALAAPAPVPAPIPMAPVMAGGRATASPVGRATASPAATAEPASEEEEAVAPKEAAKGKSGLPKMIGIAVAALAVIGGAVWFFISSPTPSDPRSRDEIFKEKENLPALFLTAITKKRIEATGNKGNFVDKDTGEIAWRAFECRNPKCPGKAPNGDLYLFITPDPGVILNPDGTLGYDERKANDAIKSGKNRGCPECLKIRNLNTESAAARERYASFVAIHVLPGTAKRLKELDEEYKRSVNAEENK